MAKALPQLGRYEKAIADAEALLTDENCPDTLKGKLLGSLPELVDWESCMGQFVDECSKELGTAIVNPWPVSTHCSSSTNTNKKSSKDKGAKAELVGNFGF